MVKLLDTNPSSNSFVVNQQQSTDYKIKMLDGSLVVPVAQISGKRNIFGLYQENPSQPVAKGFTESPLPELVIPEISKSAAKKAPSIIEPLQISLNGIVISSQPGKSLCIISDETDKEDVYYPGSKIKDGTILKILRDRVVILRLNSQIDTFFLHEQIEEPQKNPSESIKKISENEFEVVLEDFCQSITSLGNFLDHVDIVPFNDEDGKMEGLVIQPNKDNLLSSNMGFLDYDVILGFSDFQGYEKIHDLPEEIYIDSYPQRKLAYKVITSSLPGDSFKIILEREQKKIFLTYKIVSNRPEGSSKKDSRQSPKSFQLVNRKKDNEIKTHTTMQDGKESSDLKAKQNDETTAFKENQQKNFEQIRQQMLSRLAKRRGIL